MTLVKRKLTRGDCLQEPRPCNRHCPYRLDGPESCALDVADRGGLKQAEVAAILGVTKARIQQIEGQALAKVCDALGVPMPDPKDYLPDLGFVQDTSARDAFDDEVFEAVASMDEPTPPQVAERLRTTRDRAHNALVRLTEDGRLVRIRLKSVQLSYAYAVARGEAAE